MASREASKATAAIDTPMPRYPEFKITRKEKYCIYGDTRHAKNWNRLLKNEPS